MSRMATHASVALFAVSIGVGAASGSNTGRFATPLGLDEYFFVPDDNPLTPEKIELGQMLFFDRGLSADSRVSCASCHRPDRAFSGGAVRSNGVHGRPGRRNVPALINRAYGRVFAWDGRTDGLEQQVLRPFQRTDEMDLRLEALTGRLRGDAAYEERFVRTFGEPPSVADAARALASFVRAQRFGDTPFDRYQAGDVNSGSFAAAPIAPRVTRHRRSRTKSFTTPASRGVRAISGVSV
jgi:cytochrome c peroxidase